MRIDSGAIVSGGASGLGAATVRGLHAAGAHVVIADLNAEKGEALTGELGERASFAEANVTDRRRRRGGRRGRGEALRAGCGSRSAAPGSAGPSG